MRIAIVGTGKMGRGFATALSETHEVVVGSRDRQRAGEIASKTGAASSGSYAEAVDGANVVILTIPWHAMEEALPQLGDLRGTIVVDVSNPSNKREREALKPRSTAEAIQERLPRSKVFKGWNHVHARHLTQPEVGGIASSVLIAGDDPKAKRVLFTMARDMGFHPVDVGHLKAARDLDKLVGVMGFIKLGPIRVLLPGDEMR